VRALRGINSLGEWSPIQTKDSTTVLRIKRIQRGLSELYPKQDAATALTSASKIHQVEYCRIERGISERRSSTHCNC
jgi:hypothetical protein